VLAATAAGDLDQQVAEAVCVHRPATSGTAAASSFEPWLIAWLIDAGYAEHVDGTLVATPAGIELGALLG
jgi:hypothetical protein